MSAPTHEPRSLAVRASWIALCLALVAAVLFVLWVLGSEASPPDTTSQGVLTGVLPRTFLCALWGAEALAVVVGFVSFLLIRRNDAVRQAIPGIMVRSLVGIVVGLIGTLILWLVVGHMVIGF
jgi:ABC-type Mn2+/Zn2+ transport system permease subunit